MLLPVMPSIKTNAPATEAGAILLRDGFCVFTRIAGLAFNRILDFNSGFSKGHGPGFSDFGHFGLVF